MEGHILNIYGAIFMAISWSIVIGLNIFSFYKILKNNKKED
jgi:hypothetical protein